MLNRHQLKEEFIARFGSGNVQCYFAPGRINLIGEHIDYNGGYVLPAAISLGITAAVRTRDDDVVRIYSKDFNEEITFSSSEISKGENDKISWQSYILASLHVLQDHKVKLTGADILLASDLPVGAGLSSSASIECLTAYIFNEAHYGKNRKQLALDAQFAERNYVGVNCGIMDQFAIANGIREHAMLLDCSSLGCEYIPAKFKDCSLVIINSNKPRKLAESKYNERRKECEEAFAILSKIDPATVLCQVHEISLLSLGDDTLYRRARHAVLENKRVLQAADALKTGQLETFGQLLTASHVSLDEDYEVSCKELNAIIHYSTHSEGCMGARMTGAGFGGSCIALVEKNQAESFITYVGKNYTRETELIADFYVAEIVEGVKAL
jgi:galactokinase